ncbi:YiiX/YebB-like N1pC/P60 family cysteine hydrolase [Pantoea sp. MBD-2R]|uniref:YiiX/YebB-like N1pC/P60 family cysteine hydrolase n=1 Tax=Pantoea sp. MBD-2R TaxID=3141540 RepID=UPI0031834C66
MSIFGLNAGDILLVNNRTRGNIFGQKILRLQKSVNTTHIALSLGEGGFIHADKSCGVDLIFFSELINKSGGNWRVIRHSEVKDEIEDQVKKIAIFHMHKTYNKGIILRENEKSLFCSQFADVVFRNIGINIFNRENGERLITFKNALPVDFESLLLEKEKWSDVSDVYRENLEDDNIKNTLEAFFLQKRCLINIARTQRNNVSSFSEALHLMKDSHDQLPREFQDKSLDEMLSENIKGLEDSESNLLYDFWDVKSKRRKK